MILVRDAGYFFSLVPQGYKSFNALFACPIYMVEANVSPAKNSVNLKKLSFYYKISAEYIFELSYKHTRYISVLYIPLFAVQYSLHSFYQLNKKVKNAKLRIRKNI